MQHQERGDQYQNSGAAVFFRRENEPVEKERLGILADSGSGGLFIATDEAVKAGSMLRMRIYNEAAPLGQSELSVRGVVQWCSQVPKGVGVQFVDTREIKGGRLTALLERLMAPARPAHAQA
jgi:Tfp pilus assembly protein PilZ